MMPLLPASGSDDNSLTLTDEKVPQPSEGVQDNSQDVDIDNQPSTAGVTAGEEQTLTDASPHNGFTAPLQPLSNEYRTAPITGKLPEHKPGTVAKRGLFSSGVWKTRGLWLGAIGIACALYGQKVLTVDHDLKSSIRWYAVGIVVAVLAWLGTYKNKSLLVVPVRKVVEAVQTTLPVRLKANADNQKSVRAKWRRLVKRYPFVAGAWPRYLLAFAALGLNIYSAGLIHKDYYSAVGGFGWLASLILLILAFVRERKVPVQSLDANIVEIEDRTDLRFGRWGEAIIVAGIFAIALVFRFYRLGDMTTGVHGDEGEAGVDAMNILSGTPTSIFSTGWFAQPNFYYYGIAVGIKIFGANLFGDRIFSTVMGTLMLVPFYPLVRMWFGVRTAIIATVFLSISDVTVHFTRIELSNITTPLSLVIGFYFFFRGMNNKHVLNFVLSGFGFMFGLYFYNGGRLTPILLIGVLVYLFLLMPLVRIPGNYRDIRKVSPGVSRIRAFGGAIRTQTLQVLHYVPQILIFGIACIAFATPFLVYMLDHSQELNARAGEKLIFNNADRMQAQYGVSHQVSHAPLYIGLRWPTDNDIYPINPVVFEQTPVSLKLEDDGFWTRVLWGQTTTTLSILTYRAEACSFYTFTGEPIAKPIEAALIIIGIAWSLWRWRDTRMAMLSLWFWSAIFAGGVLTIDAPYMCRIIGIVPTTAIFAALPLSKLSAEMIGAFSRLVWKKVRGWRPNWKKVSTVVSTTAVAALLAYLTFQNFNDYYSRYLATFPFSEVTGQAQFVQDMNAEVTEESRPQPVYYHLGMHMIFWEHGVNRFINYGTDGHNMANPSNELPILGNNGRDVVFIVWNLNSHYMEAIKHYYPEGEEGSYTFPPGNPAGSLFRYYRVTKEQIDARRVSTATYTPTNAANSPDASGASDASGGSSASPITRVEAGIGSTIAPPAGMSYPVNAEWHSELVAPAFALYKFSLSTEGTGNLLIDGTPVLTNTVGTTRSEGEVLLARGPHDVRVAGTLASATSRVALAWSSGGAAPNAINNQYLWSGNDRGLLGVIRPYSGDVGTLSTGGAANVTSVRLDGFLGFRDSPSVLGGSPFDATWTGTIMIPQDGQYTFDVFSNGGSGVFIDDQLLFANPNNSTQPTQGTGQVRLTAGPHKYELRYSWLGGTGYLEAFWTPPNGARALISTDVLHTDGGIVDPAIVASTPPGVNVNPESSNPAPAPVIKPTKVLGLGDAGISKPRGLAVDKAGNIYVGDRANHRIVVLAPDGNVVKTWGKAAPIAPQGQATKPAPYEFGDFTDLAVLDNNLNGADPTKVTVYALDSLGQVQTFTGSGDYIGTYDASQLALFAGNGITLSEDSTTNPASLYIAVSGQSRVVKLPSIQLLLSNQQGKPDSSGVLGSMSENITGTGGDKLEQPVDVIADPSNPNTLYVIDLRDRIVQFKLATGGDATPATGANQGGWTITNSWSLPVGRDDGASRLGISPNGTYVYMSDPDRKRVAVLDVKNSTISYFGTDGTAEGQFRGPLGIAVGANGQLYVLDRDRNNIQVFPATGK